MKKILLMILIGFLITPLSSHGFTSSEKRSHKINNVAAQVDTKKNGQTSAKAVYSCPMHPKVVQDKPGKCPECKMNLVKKSNYTCPMHPEVIQDKPGKCAKCKMNLVEKDVTKEVYTCSMHPEVALDKPGKCPKCKMNLIKKEPAKKD